MEAAPKLPMLNFELKVSTENASFSQPLKQYIAQFYNENPESYNNEIHTLESLRCGAVRPSIDVEGCQLLKKYYCQLHFLKSRFPMEELQKAAVYFSWKDTYSTLACRLPDINFELSCILYNIGAIHSQLGSMEKRTTSDGMKIACSHFQCAAWAFQMCRENYHQMVSNISSIFVVNFMEYVCLAQAQECILEKSMLDNRKATIIAKVAAQVADFYHKANATLQTGLEENSNYGDLIKHVIVQEWTVYTNFKEAYHKCITLLFQGQQAEEQQKMGERLAFYEASLAQLEKARKLGQMLMHKQDVVEALSFTSDVVEGKKKAAKNDNEFIYHEAIPHLDTLPEVKGASLVKGTSFSINDAEVSGPDIFSKLIPMEVHEASSLYSEKKAEVLRKYAEMIEEKDQKLAEFMSSLQIDFLSEIRQASGLPQDLIDRAAALSALPNVVKELTDCMTAFSSSYEDVETLLYEINELFKVDSKNEEEYQKLMGKRPPSRITIDLETETLKFKQAHDKANTSNHNLHRVMCNHVENLKHLSQPLAKLQTLIPSVDMKDASIDEQALKEIEMLIAKVEEMKTQRAVLWAQLRDALHKDDITRAIVTKQENQTMDDMFQQELQKHNQLTSLIEQNVAAQENIMKAIIDAHARFANTKVHLQNLLSKRNFAIACLSQSFDKHEELLMKAIKGKKFYNKMEANLSKLHQRVKSACDVQQEEREQMLAKLPATSKPIKTNTVENPGPKLRDYLESRETAERVKNLVEQHPQIGNIPNPSQNPSDAPVWPTTVRPQPVGSEVDKSTAQYDMYSSYKPVSYESNNMNAVDYKNYGADINQYSYYNSRKEIENNQYPNPVDSTDADRMLASRLSALTTNDKGYGQVPSNQLGYNAYSQQNYGSYTQQGASDSKYPLMSTAQPSTSFYVPPVGYNKPDVVPTTVETYNQPSNWNNPSTYSFSATNCSTNNSHPNNQSFGTDLQYHPNNFATYTQVNMSNFSTNSAGYNSLYNPTGNDVYGQNYSSSNVPNVYPDQNTVPNVGNTVLQDPSQNNYYFQSSYQSINENMYQNIYSHAFNSPMNVSSTYNPQTYLAGNENVMAGTSSSYSKNVTENIPFNPTNVSRDSNMSTQYNQPSVYPYNYIPNQPPVVTLSQTSISSVSSQEIKKQDLSNIDLLCGLDFNINQAPLEPMTKVEQKCEANVGQKIEPSVPILSTSTTITDSVQSVPKQAQVKSIAVVPSKPLDNDDVKYLLKKETEKYEKFVDMLSNKTLNGPTNIELKWKEIQDTQEKEVDKKIISVARCYPLKNRFSDILPYDYSRVVLTSAQDDYINASYIKDISPYVSPMIVTQAPLHSSVLDFWKMIHEQHVEFILCLQSDDEMGQDKYWPVEKGKDVSIGDMVVSLQNVISKDFWVERLIRLSIPERRENIMIFHLQFIGWPGSLFPTTPEPFVSFIKYFITLYQQQKCLTHPFVVHCLSGIGRSGVACLLIAAILELTNRPTNVPDLISLTNKITSFKKNILRDKEHLKFGYQCLLTYMKQLNTNEEPIKSEVKQVIKPTVPKTEIDPLSSLDAFWANKK